MPYYVKPQLCYLRSAHQLIFEINDIGYQAIWASHHQVKSGQTKMIYIYHHRFKDVVTDYCFAQENEYQMFKLIISVPGIGVKSAALLLQNKPLLKIQKAINTGDVIFFKKLAIKTFSLTKIKKFILQYHLNEVHTLHSNYQRDLVTALHQLGFAMIEIITAIKQTTVIPDQQMYLQNLISNINHAPINNWHNREH